MTRRLSAAISLYFIASPDCVPLKLASKVSGVNVKRRISFTKRCLYVSAPSVSYSFTKYFASGVDPLGLGLSSIIMILARLKANETASFELGTTFPSSSRSFGAVPVYGFPVIIKIASIASC